MLVLRGINGSPLSLAQTSFLQIFPPYLFSPFYFIIYRLIVKLFRFKIIRIMDELEEKFFRLEETKVFDVKVLGKIDKGNKFSSFFRTVTKHWKFKFKGKSYENEI